MTVTINIVGKEFLGRTVKVEFATYLEPIGGFGGGGRGGRGGGRGDGGFRGGGRGRGRGGGGGGGGGFGQPNFVASEGDWQCPDQG